MNETSIATPGVYIHEISTFPPSVAQVDTAIPAFIGYTAKAEDYDGVSLIDIPTKIFSFKAYEDFYGAAEKEDKLEVTITRKTENGNVVLKSAKAAFKANATQSKHIMHDSIRLYFDNGGGPCYIVSVGETSTEEIIDNTKLNTGLEKLAAFDEPTLIIFPEGKGIADAADYYALIDAALKQCNDLQDRFTIIDVHTPNSSITKTTSDFRTGVGIDNLSYGAVYYPNLRTTFDFRYDESVIDVSINTVGGATTNFKLDKLKNPTNPTDIDLEAYYAALAALKKLSPELPPSPAIAGVYARVDGNRGVWKAPANVSLNSVYETTYPISDDQQANMNKDPGTGKSINAIRVFEGKGILVWGARTLDGNSNEWRYISVRRFFIMVEESCKKATAQFVFDPNDSNTWIKIRAMIENFLTLQWRQGALAGAKPEHAFFVKCGLGQTMTAQDINDGKLIVEIGMAAVRPAEFIILRFMHKLQES